MAVPIKNVNRYNYDIDFYDLSSVGFGYIRKIHLSDQDFKRLTRAYDSGNFNTYTMPNGQLAPDYFEAFKIENALTFVLRLIKNDSGDDEGTFDEFGNMRTSEYSPILEVAPYKKSIFRDRVESVGNPQVTLVNGEYLVSTGTGDWVSFQTALWGRYLPALVGLPGMGIRIASRTAGTVIKWGYFYGNVGFYFRLDDNGWWAVVEDGANNIIFEREQADWDDPLDGTGLSGRSLVPSDGVISRFPFIWYGYGPIRFVVMSKDGKKEELIEVCRASFTNRASISKPNRPINIEVDGEAEVYVGGRQYGVFGRYVPSFRTRSKRREGVSVTTTWRPVMGFYQDIDSDLAQVMVKFNNVDGVTDASLAWEVRVASTGVDLTTFTTMTSESSVKWNLTLSATDANDDGVVVGSGFITSAKGSSSGSGGEKLASESVPKNLPVILWVKTLGGGATASFTMSLLEEW